jgi:hypothetical protein
MAREIGARERARTTASAVARRLGGGGGQR